ncbi:MAG: tripartite tricarboxylate transporter substrate binding protein [Pseudolabrys sp.]
MKFPFGPIGLTVTMLIASMAIGHAQGRYPERPVQVVIPATPGGPVDTAVRLLEPRLSAALGETAVLLNKPGASGTIGMNTVATAEPNGYTIGQGVNSIFTVTRVSGTNVPFSLDDFTLLGNYASDVSVLAVHPDAPWKTFDDLLKDVAANPGQRTYASAGVGTVSALSMEALRHHLKMDMTAVPFPGGSQLTVAILGRHIDVGMVPYSTGAAMFRDGKLRPLLTTAAQRLPTLQNVPTLAEKGIKTRGLNLTMGLYAPRGLNPEVRKTLVAAVRTAAQDAETVKKLEGIGLLPSYEDAETALQRLKSEYDDIVALKKEIGK